MVPHNDNDHLTFLDWICTALGIVWPRRLQSDTHVIGGRNHLNRLHLSASEIDEATE